MLYKTDPPGVALLLGARRWRSTRGFPSTWARGGQVALLEDDNRGYFHRSLCTCVPLYTYALRSRFPSTQGLWDVRGGRLRDWELNTALSRFGGDPVVVTTGIPWQPLFFVGRKIQE